MAKRKSERQKGNRKMEIEHAQLHSASSSIICLFRFFFSILGVPCTLKNRKTEEKSEFVKIGNA